MGNRTPSRSTQQHAFSGESVLNRQASTLSAAALGRPVRNLRRTHVPCGVVSAIRACASMRRKVVPDQLAVLHHESNSLQLANVGDRISSKGDRLSDLGPTT